MKRRIFVLIAFSLFMIVILISFAGCGSSSQYDSPGTAAGAVSMEAQESGNTVFFNMRELVIRRRHLCSEMDRDYYSVLYDGAVCGLRAAGKL